MNLFKELRRRNVFRVVLAYLIVGWLVLQVADVLVDALELPVVWSNADHRLHPCRGFFMDL